MSRSSPPLLAGAARVLQSARGVHGFNRCIGEPGRGGSEEGVEAEELDYEECLPLLGLKMDEGWSVTIAF